MDNFIVDQDLQVILRNEEDGTSTPIKGGITAQGFEVISTYQKGWLTFAYLRDHQGIWWFNARKNKASLFSQDTEAFRIIDEDYCCDSQYVYLEDQAVPNSDPSSFRLLSDTPYFAQDQRYLYVKSSGHFHLFEDIDTNGVIAYHDYCTDQDHLFHLSSSLRYANGEKDEVRAWLREHHPDVPGWWQPDYAYGTEGATQITGNWVENTSSVFYRTEWGGTPHREAKVVFNLVRGADRSSFEPLDEQFARDRERVYFQWRILKGADPDTFQPLGGPFGRDRNHVYYNGYRVDEADVRQFEVFAGTEHLGISKDQQHVYRAEVVRTSQPFGHPDNMLQMIKGADSSTFELITPSGSWAVDANRVYLWGKPNKHMDRASFTYLFDADPQSWALDQNGLYNANGKRTVKGVNGSAFVMLNEYWGKDDRVVFSFVTGSVYKSGDAATFQVTDDIGGAEDALFRYTVEGGTVRKRKRATEL
ncbi:DKNYY domain-containing protein [Paenibacillus sp. SAF-068]|uniref:DKNYY domain-containing protein n=1 Tax=Paenibacillus sp. SAF-068 TaxID=3436864 RepID=UPI003F80487F